MIAFVHPFLAARVNLRKIQTTSTKTISMAISRASKSQLYISGAKAASIDEALMSPRYGHTLTQLMELAGLAVAHAIVDFKPYFTRTSSSDTPPRICIVCGPGNNGGDGLVAARHLHHFGYPVTVHYPKQRDKEPFVGLLTQLHMLDIPVITDLPLPQSDLIVDAIFGFSFDGSKGVRQPFADVIDAINIHTASVLAVDIPSGWHVDKGDIHDQHYVKHVDAIISLTAPKHCAAIAEERGATHYIGGRFVPKKLCEELDFQVPSYSGVNGIIRLN